MKYIKDVTRRPLRVSVLGLRALTGAQGGIETHVRDLVAGLLANHGKELELEVVERSPYVQPDRQLPVWAKTVSLPSLWSPRAAGLEAIVHTALGVLRAGWTRPDVLHIHGIGPAMVTPLARLLGLRVVVTHHGQDYVREKWGGFAKRMLRIGERMAALCANERIVIAPGLSEVLFGMYRRNFVFIPNAAPAFGREEGIDLLERHGLQPQRYVVHVGRFVPEKRQTDLIEAFRRAAPAGWKLVLVGGNDHPSAYERKVREDAQATENVVLTGVLGGRAISQLLSHAGLFALPSTHEGLPIALLEAMTIGAPVLVSDLPSLVPLKLPPECYVAAGNVDALTDALRQRVVAEENRSPCGVDWSEWLRPFTIPSVASQTLVVYQRAVGRLQSSQAT